MVTDRDILYNGISKAAWGYVLLNFDFNLGTVSILPRFVGYMLLLTAIRHLAGERKDLLLLKPLCLFLIAYNGVDWLFSWFQESLDGKVLFLDLIATAAGLYFHFQFLTDMAALAERVKLPKMMLDSSIRTRRIIYVVLTTVLSLLTYILPAGKLETLETGGITLLLLALVAGIVSLTVIFALLSLRKYVKYAPRELWD